MKNWVICDLELSFSKKDIYDVWSRIFSNERFKMNQFFIPLSVKKEDYRVLKTQELWGAKWEVDISKVEKDDDLKKIKTNYQCVWSPNIPVLKEIYNRLQERDANADLYCYYHDLNMRFRGYIKNTEHKYFPQDNFHKQVILKHSLFEEEHKISFSKTGLIIAENENETCSFIIDKDKSEKKISCELDGEKEYIEHTCFSETYGEDICVIEYNGKIYL